jgi:hypothetical protein
LDKSDYSALKRAQANIANKPQKVCGLAQNYFVVKRARLTGLDPWKKIIGYSWFIARTAVRLSA